MRRRDFLAFTAAASLTPIGSIFAAQPKKFRAVAFDAFPIFDPRPIAALAESLFPEKGTLLMNAWRTRQFEYQWQRALAHQYADFLQTTEQSLIFACRQLQLELPSATRQQLMATYSNLQVWPDAPKALEQLHQAGIRLAFLSNMTEGTLRDGITKAGLAPLFESILSTDRIQTYKPDPRAYQLAVEELNLKPQEIVFAAFAGWDVAGAKWFGYPTFWVNRLGSPMEELGVAADDTGQNLNQLVQFVLS